MSIALGTPLDGIKLLRLERTLLAGGIAIVTALCWLYLAAPPSGTSRAAVSAHELTVALPTWAVMMTAMMLPTAMPMVLTFAAASRRVRRGHIARVLLFVSAYVGLWLVFSAAGAVSQVWLRSAGLLSGQGASTQPFLSGALLLVAGAYQLSPLKQTCLHRCRSPLGVLLTDWRPGAAGALRMGLRHGVNCVLCCWALMALMFVLGTMNLVWMALLMLFVVAEKTLPGGPRAGNAAGLALLVWGAWLVAAGL